jgi:hypothetical protein
MMEEQDGKVKEAIVEWRYQHALEKIGPGLLRKYGAKYLMSESMMDRLVACIQVQKIKTLDDIHRETNWQMP